MSDDLLRVARQLQADLDAHEAALRALAVQSLDYAGVRRAERRADERAEILLEPLGMSLYDGVVEGWVADRAAAAPARRRASVAPPAETPQTAAPRTATPRTSSRSAAPRAASTPPKAASVPPKAASVPPKAASKPPRAASAPPPRASTPPPADPPLRAVPSYVTFEDEDEHDKPTISASVAAEVEDMSGLVTFESRPERKEASDTPATVATRTARPSAGRRALTDPGRAAQSETFDLIPDLSEEPNPFDDEVTVLKAIPKEGRRDAGACARVEPPPALAGARPVAGTERHAEQPQHLEPQPEQRQARAAAGRARAHRPPATWRARRPRARAPAPGRRPPRPRRSAPRSRRAAACRTRPTPPPRRAAAARRPRRCAPPPRPAPRPAARRARRPRPRAPAPAPPPRPPRPRPSPRPRRAARG
ncbi:MAG: hypothetical protein R3F59_20615 [Myxococcota bacterium]